MPSLRPFRVSDATAARQLAVRIGRIFKAEARVDFTPAGLLATGALVSAVLLGTAVIVAAGRIRRKAVLKIEAPTAPD